MSKLPELKKKEINNELNLINNQVYQSLEKLKEIASDLRPGVLDKLGLDAAIEWQLKQFQARTKIRCKQNIEELSQDLDSNKSTALFRSFQEILTNIIRHAQADRVIVDLTNNHNNIALKVRDNGIGINQDEVDNAESLGLLGMQERASMLGGDFKIKSLKQGGTEVIITIPV